VRSTRERSVHGIHPAFQRPRTPNRAVRVDVVRARAGADLGGRRGAEVVERHPNNGSSKSAKRIPFKPAIDSFQWSQRGSEDFVMRNPSAVRGNHGVIGPQITIALSRFVIFLHLHSIEWPLVSKLI
jgi:hypothetical protein